MYKPTPPQPRLIARACRTVSFMDFMVALAVIIMVVGLLMNAQSASAEAVSVEVQQNDNGFELLRDGKPYEVKGAGGDADKQLLVDAGANSFRTWGVDQISMEQLDEAHEKGLTVAMGLWLGHARHGFDYGDPAQVQKQFDDAKAAVLKYKDHPAVLVWGVGNEMEEYDETSDPRVWKAVNDIAAMIQEVDPHHPTMTVIAEIGGDKLASIKQYCPAIDIVGINTYGGVTSIPDRYAAANMDRPYMVTEFGPPGPWEQGNNEWGVPMELTSTQKGDIYRRAYETIHADPMSLGSYAFTWGAKQEATATWFGMFLPDGQKTAAVDVMTELWSGQAPANRSPEIQSFALRGNGVVRPGGKVQADLSVSDPEGETPKVRWVLFQEMEEFNTAGDYRPAPPTFPEAISNAGPEGVTLTMPDRPGRYRLFAYVSDSADGGAVANLPLLVEGKDDKNRGGHANLPLVVYGDDMQGTPYVASGYMGETGAIQMNEKATTNPKAGQTCIEATYAAPGGWGGVVWQSPVNDWGEQPGGYDLTGATSLSFWARGANGGETVKFGYGILGRDKKFYDTAKEETAITLTNQWKQYHFDLAGKDLTRIKTGFYWVLAGQGKPVKFYLDDIVFHADTGDAPE